MSGIQAGQKLDAVLKLAECIEVHASNLVFIRIFVERCGSLEETWKKGLKLWDKTQEA